MYMGPIVPAKTQAPVLPALHAAVGVVVLLGCALVMAPLLTCFAAYVVMAFAGRAVWRGPQRVIQLIDYARSIVIGR